MEDMKNRFIEYLNTDMSGCDGDYAENMADYLLLKGAVAPPVEIGQTVWFIEGGYYNSVNKKPKAITVTEINLKKIRGKAEWGFSANGTRYKFTSIGKTVFLSVKDAENFLKAK